MLSCNPVADIAYLIGKQEDRERAGGEASGSGAVSVSLSALAGQDAQPSGKDRIQALREGVRVHRGNSYYDKDSSEEEGIFWRPKLKESDRARMMTLEDGKEPRVGAGRRIAEGIPEGQGIPTKVARLLSMGYDPVTKERLVPSACAWHEKKAMYPEKMSETERKRAPRAGYDCTFSIDKPASALWADALTRGDLKQAKAIESALMAAVNDAKQFAFDNGLYRTRRAEKDPVTGERIEYFEPVSDLTSASFLHKTNRNGDAQLHIHDLALNVCARQDGTTGTLAMDEFWYQKPVIDAVFKAAFYDRLRQIEGLEDIDIVRGEKDVRIRGISKQLTETLSSRRLEVVEELEKRGLTTADRRAAEIAAKDTRNEKTDLPPLSQLTDRWRETILQYTDGEGLLAKLKKRAPLEQDRDARILRIAMEAVERFGHTQTIVTERDVLTEVYRSAQGEFGIHEIPEIVHFVKSRFLIQGEYDQDGRQQWGIVDLVEKERSFMSMCYDLPKLPPMATDRDIQKVIGKYRADPVTKRRGLNDEQKQGIRYILTSDSAISILEGSAGAGKSFTAGRIQEVLEPSGYKVFGISPSWKATDVLREDMNLHDEMAKACAKFIADFKTKKIEIDSNTIVAIDEAGMVGIDDMEFISRTVTENGGRLILLGDTRQLSPVAAGSPMAMARKVLGSHRLNEIMRQTDPDNPERAARYREASGLFVRQGKENIAKALGIYNDEGRISWKQTLEETYHAAADKFLEVYDPERAKESLIITKRNTDLHAINAEVRKSMIEMGLLGEDEVTFEALTRDSKDKEFGYQLSLRAGERVIFGERLEKQVTGLPIPINNSDMATVKAVHTDPKTGEPILLLVFDKAPKLTVRATPRQLSGFREEDEKLIPKMQHAYCVTVHASQGATVDQVVVADCHGMDYRTTYVAMTRHRHDAHLVVNVDRIEDNKAAKAGIVIIDDNGKMSIPDKDDARQDIAPEDFKYGPEEYLAYIVHEASIVDDKKNFTDLDMYSGSGKLRAFLDDKDWKQTHIDRLKEKVGNQLDIQETRILNNKARLEGKIGASLAADGFTINPDRVIEGRVNPYRDVKAPSIAPDLETHGGGAMDEALKQKISARVMAMRGVVRPPRPRTDTAAPVPPKEKVEVRKSMRISDAEREEFKRRDPIQFMLDNGAVLAKPWERQNPRSVEMCDGFKGNEPYNRYTVSERNGVWVWNQWNDTEMKGTLDAWMVKKGVASSYPEAWHRLRAEFGTESLQDTKVVVKPQVEKTKPVHQQYQETIASQLATTGFPSTPGKQKAEDRLRAAVYLVKQKEEAAKDNPGNPALQPTKEERLKANLASRYLAAIEKGNDPRADKRDLFKAEKARELAEAGKSYHEFRFKYEMQAPWATDSFPRERGIERATIVYFGDDVRREPFKDWKSGEWKAGLAFAHRDVQKWGTITGIESKRPEAFASNGEPLPKTRFTEGEGKGLGMLGQKLRGKANEIVVAESGIDALSWWQANKLPSDFKSKSDEEKLKIASKVPQGTLLLSTAGTSSAHAMQGIELLAKANPQAKWIIAPDNDQAGHRIRDDVREAILKGNPKARIEIHAPESILYKDWNDQVRQQPRSPEDLQKTADRLGLTSDFVQQEVTRFENQNPDRDVSAYRNIGSKAADAAEEKKAIEFPTKADDKQVREHITEKRQEVSGPVQMTGSESEVARAAEEVRRRQEEEDRQRQRGAIQKM